ncbi:MAG: hypothetical protein Q8P20_09885 [bacterium]|nr:hypothetical protein [bacterium]
MKNISGFTYIAIIILISLMAVGFVGIAWYYEDNKEDIDIVSNATTTTTINAADDTTEWQTYTNNTYGYSIQYPSDWEVIETTSVVTSLTPKGENYYWEGSKEYPITIGGHNEAVSSLLSDVSDDKRTTVTINNQNAIKYTGYFDSISYQFDNIDTGGSVGISSFAKQLLGAGSINESKYNELESTFKQILSTIIVGGVDTNELVNINTTTNSNQVTNTNIPSDEERFKSKIIVNDYSHLFVNQFHNVSIADIGCNDDYCLLSTRYQDDRIFKFQNGNFLELTDDFRSLTYLSGENVNNINFEWNGEYWMIGYGEYLITFDGKDYNKIYTTQNKKYVSAISWNGTYWMVGLNPSSGNNITLDVVTVSNSSSEPKISDPITIYKLLSGKITSIAWNGEKWLIGGYKRDINSDNSPVLGLYINKAEGIEEFKDITTHIPITGRNEITGIEWYEDEWLISFLGDDSSIYYYNDDQFTNISDQFQQDISIQSMDSEGSIASAIPLRSIIYNSEIFDLSNLYTKPLHTTTVYKNKVYWGGAMGFIEITIPE